jgi:hypothetical protein
MRPLAAAGCSRVAETLLPSLDVHDADSSGRKRSSTVQDAWKRQGCVAAAADGASRFCIARMHRWGCMRRGQVVSGCQRCVMSSWAQQ